MLQISLTTEDVYTKIRELLINILPFGVEVVQGIGNGVPMPAGGEGFVAMTANLLSPHRTPQTSWDISNPSPGAIAIEQGTVIRLQLDCYGPQSGDWAIMLCAILRDEYGAKFIGPHVFPLYADDPIQAALVNGEEQYEQRWIVGARLQYNPVITTPMQFADRLNVNLIEVDERVKP